MRFVRIGDIGIASVNVQGAGGLHSVEILVFAESGEALGLLVGGCIPSSQ
jgi:hypothetical protein